METRKESRSCRICGSVVPPTHWAALFSTKSLNSGLAERLSKVADVPVAPDDGLTKFTGTSATLLSLFARPEFKDFVEKSATQCVGGTTLPQILQDLDSFLVSIS